MSKAKKIEKQVERREMTGSERLGLRVAEMINHPAAQVQRWVTIHQLDTDAQSDWDGMMEILVATDGIELTFNDDGTVTVRWERSEDDQDRAMSLEEVALMEDEAPF
jgi:hypothetical protein